ADTMRDIVQLGLQKLNLQEQLAALPPSKGIASALEDLDASGTPAGVEAPAGPSSSPPDLQDFVRSGVFGSLEREGSPRSARIWRALDDGTLVLRVNRTPAEIAAARPNEIDIDIPNGPLDNRDITLGRVFALAEQRLAAFEAEGLPAPAT